MGGGEEERRWEGAQRCRAGQANHAGPSYTSLDTHTGVSAAAVHVGPPTPRVAVRPDHTRHSPDDCCSGPVTLLVRGEDSCSLLAAAGEMTASHEGH